MMNSSQQKWLQEILTAKGGDLSDDDIFVLLENPALTEEDLQAGIGFVETWLSERAIPSLFRVLQRDNIRIETRLRAATAMAAIGYESIESELLRWVTDEDSAVRAPVAIALGKGEQSAA